MTFIQTVLSDLQNIKVIIDPYQQITESDKTNNERTVTLSALLPDLIIRDITWSPTEVAVGDNVTFTAIIKNQGTGKAESSRLAYYIGSFTWATSMFRR